MRRSVPLLLCALLGMVAYSSAPQLQWPPPPDPPRMKFVREFTGITPAPETGWFSGMIRRLVGLKPGERADKSLRLMNPTGLFVRDRILYVADRGARKVLRYDEAADETEWLPKSRTPILFSPVGVAAAPDGRVFIADSALRRVFILDKDGKQAGEFKGDPQGMGRPVALAMSKDRVFVTDVQGHRVSAYGLDGIFLYSFGKRGSSPGEFNYPTYAWFDEPKNRLWVCDSGNFRVQWLDPEGQPLGEFGEPGDRPGFLARPRGLALDSDRNVYLMDGAFEAMQIFDQVGHLLLFVGRAGGAPGQFNLPGGIFADESDRIFVADTHNGRVQVFQYLKEQVP